MKKNKNKAIDWGCSKKHGLFFKNCEQYSSIHCSMFVRGALTKKLHKRNFWCVEVNGVSFSDEIVKVIEKCYGCGYDVVKKWKVIKMKRN